MISPPLSHPINPAQSFPPCRNRRAVALVIVLAFVVLLTGLTVAFFSSSLLYRQISNSSASEAKVDLFAQGAVDTIVGDLKQEIAAGSNATLFTDTNGNVVARTYLPTNASNAVPAQALAGATPAPGVTSYAPNLVKRSAQGQDFFPAGANLTSSTVPVATGPATPMTIPAPVPPRRAANVSTTAPSLNGRFISPARWNKPLLVQKKSYTTSGAADANDTDFTPDPAAFYPPDWVLTARNGSNPTGSTLSSDMTTSASGGLSVVGRYAYTIYDEGGLLDMNVAGYPRTLGGTGDSKTIPYKNCLAFAELTRLPGISGLAAGRLTPALNDIVGWRNFSTAQVTTGTLAGNNFNFTGTPLTRFSTAMLSNTNGFLRANSSVDPGTTRGQSDRMFASRQELIRLLLNTIAQSANERANLQDALQYLGTFSRGLDQPSYVPAVHSSTAAPRVLPVTSGGTNAVGLDREINPSFLKVRTPVVFTRNDGSTAAAGDPLVQKRFALQRLAWLTYKGPSQGRPQTDPDIAALIAAGIPYSYLQLGTPDNIKKYFGLVWDNSGKWQYGEDNTVGPIKRIGRDPAVDPTPDSSKYVQDLATPRDPDFFELLKSALTVGSLGKSLVSSVTGGGNDGENTTVYQPFNYRYNLDASIDRQVMQIGANIINQSRVDNFPVVIMFNDGSGSTSSPALRAIVGVANLPYLYNVIGGALQLDPSKATGVNADGSTATDKLPRQAGGSGDLDTGIEFHNSGYKKTDKVTSSGVVAYLDMPVVWNPHDPSSPQVAVGLTATGYTPTSFRVVADSTTPDQVEDLFVGQAAGSHNKFFVYGASSESDNSTGGTPGGSSGPYYSYLADSTSPGDNGGGRNKPDWYQDTDGSTIGHEFNAANTEIDFTANSGTKPLFPEPTVLMRPQTLTDSNGNAISVSVPTGPTHHLMSYDPAVSGFFSGAGLKAFYANPLNMQSGETNYPATTPYIGIYLGAIPMSWVVAVTGTDAISASSVQSGCVLAKVNGSSSIPTGNPAACYLTYRLQYKDPVGGQWITYDTKYGNAAGATPTKFGCKAPSLMAGYNGRGGYYSTAVDPRTARFGMISHFAADSIDGPGGNGVMGSYPAPEAEGQWDDTTFTVKKAATGWLDSANGVINTMRPDGHPGYVIWSAPGWPSGGVSAATGWMAWVASNDSTQPGLAPGLLSQNNSDVYQGMTRQWGLQKGNDDHTPNYFADPDGIVRRAMGGFVPTATTSSPTYVNVAGVYGNLGLPSSDTTVGLPLARAFDWPVGAPYKPSGTPMPPYGPCPTITPYSQTAATPPTTPPVTSQAQSRPYFLHRPFRSVGELGYVFSDTPWRNIDFFTAESGSVALLDVFCVNDTTNTSPLVAGKVNLNTRQAPVLQAVLAGGYLDSAQPTSTGVTGSLSTDTAKSLAAALIARTTDTANNASGTGPLQNVSDLVGRWIQNMAVKQLPSGSCPAGIYSVTNKGTLDSAAKFYDGKISYAGFSGGVWDNTSTNLGATSRKPYVNGVEDFSTGNPKSVGTAMDVYSAYASSSPFASDSSTNHNGSKETASYIQRFREAPIRALTASGQTRVWNLMIDLVAQTGRYPSNASDLKQFVVEGEQRYWVHLAIDRYTGEVIDKQIEVVKE